MDFRPSFERTLAALVGLTALVAALVTLLELDSSRRSNRAASEATRRSVVLFEDIARGDLLLRYQYASLGKQAALISAGQTRQQFPLSTVESAVGNADRAAAASWRRFDVPLVHLPQGKAGQAALARQSSERAKTRNADYTEEHYDEGLAERYARRDTRSTFSLSLTAIAATLFGLAGVLRAGRAGWLTLSTGAAALVAASAVAGWAILT